MPPPAISLMFASASLALVTASFVSVQDEIALGRRVQAKLQSELPRVSDREVVAYVGAIGKRLASRAGGPAYPYSFTVARNPEINAFALPGGPVWVHTGAIRAAATEAQFAGVLAHEIAHVARRHAARQISNTVVANGLLGALGALLGNDVGGARAAQAGAQVLAGSYMLKFGREDERDADRVGAEIMRRAGWDPRAMADFMDTLRRAQGRDPGSVEVFLSSHPGAAERASLLRQQLRGVAGGRMDSSEFRRMKGRVRG